jgi:putative flippase GtrA
MFLSRLAHILNDTALRNQVLRFIVTGFVGLFTDVLTYRALVNLSVHVTPAKALGCVAGTVVVFFINRAWTFSSQKKNLTQFVRFSALYATSISINTVINTAVLGVIAQPWLVAFFAATSVSTIMNFVGLKFFVFSESQITEVEEPVAELSQ